jgi:hypothetical protein
MAVRPSEIMPVRRTSGSDRKDHITAAAATKACGRRVRLRLDFFSESGYTMTARFTRVLKNGV